MDDDFESKEDDSDELPPTRIVQLVWKESCPTFVPLNGLPLCDETRKGLQCMLNVIGNGGDLVDADGYSFKTKTDSVDYHKLSYSATCYCNELLKIVPG
ncbi:hypothetical protein A3D88_02980 [Candidatus Peribacteria bacterium RIFCSPHIGHO2_02_FULL_52_16]|nr:MAG: hypothetical protein A2706_06045 [Candidatus Peribacteria bacterium RIFCSPHIGHO2_01_FULL_51_35]OGJ60644.1 MAG: hypothetical protein A3D88_02980 [Candidatus Peribacteria bacterium RIFCSPHIGHO2_02_FULL_52_16]